MDMWEKTEQDLCRELDQGLYLPFLKLVGEKEHDFGNRKEAFKRLIHTAIENLRMKVEIGELLDPSLTGDDITEIRENAEKLVFEPIDMVETGDRKAIVLGKVSKKPANVEVVVTGGVAKLVEQEYHPKFPRYCPGVHCDYYKALKKKLEDEVVPVEYSKMYCETYVCANRDCGGNLMYPCVTHDYTKAKCRNPGFVAKWVSLEDFCTGWFRMGKRALIKDVAKALDKEGRDIKLSVRTENMGMKEECYDVVVLFGKILNEDGRIEKRDE